MCSCLNTSTITVRSPLLPHLLRLSALVDFQLLIYSTPSYKRERKDRLGEPFDVVSYEKIPLKLIRLNFDYRAGTLLASKNVDTAACCVYMVQKIKPLHVYTSYFLHFFVRLYSSPRVLRFQTFENQTNTLPFIQKKPKSTYIKYGRTYLFMLVSMLEKDDRQFYPHPSHQLTMMMIHTCLNINGIRLNYISARISIYIFVYVKHCVSFMPSQFAQSFLFPFVCACVFSDEWL